MGVKIVTWNINGLRSFGDQKQFRSSLFDQFDGQIVDILCVQETKISRSSLTEWMAFIPGYTSYFTFPSSDANHLKHQSGYSGVATYAREISNCRPWSTETALINDVREIFIDDVFDHLEEDYCFEKRWSKKLKLNADDDHISWRQVDREGRCIVSKHSFKIDNCNNINGTNKWLYIFNLYCPRNDQSRPDRELFQLKFYHIVERRIKALFDKDDQNYVMIVGDLNTAHQSIDVYDDNEFSYLDSNSRQWLHELLEQKKLIDAFRLINGYIVTDAFTCWNPLIGGRHTNYGSRIDYILVDSRLSSLIKNCKHLTNVQGSDHCPVMLEFDDQLKFINPDSNFYSINCTKHWPEFDPQKQLGSIRRFLITSSSDKDDKNQSLSSQSQMTEKSQSKHKQQQQTKISSFLTGKKLIKSAEKQAIEPFDNASTLSVASSSSSNQSEKWKQLMNKKNSPKQSIPLCHGHGLPCVKRKVRKPGPNYGLEFYQCSKPSLKPEGHPETRCNFFRWIR